MAVRLGDRGASSVTIIKSRNARRLAALDVSRCSTIKWVQDLAGFEDPCSSSLVLHLFESTRRILSIPIRKKAVTPEDIWLLFDKFTFHYRIRVPPRIYIYICRKFTTTHCF